MSGFAVAGGFGADGSTVLGARGNSWDSFAGLGFEEDAPLPFASEDMSVTYSASFMI